MSIYFHACRLRRFATTALIWTPKPGVVTLLSVRFSRDEEGLTSPSIKLITDEGIEGDQL
jgi:hypothetical protein